MRRDGARAGICLRPASCIPVGRYHFYTLQQLGRVPQHRWEEQQTRAATLQDRCSTELAARRGISWQQAPLGLPGPPLHPWFV